MWKHSPEFTLPQFPGQTFRVRSLSPNWRDDVADRMAVIEALCSCTWFDFMTIREPHEVEQVETALRGRR